MWGENKYTKIRTKRNVENNSQALVIDGNHVTHCEYVNICSVC